MYRVLNVRYCRLTEVCQITYTFKKKTINIQVWKYFYFIKYLLYDILE